MCNTRPTLVMVCPAHAKGLLGSSFRQRHSIVSAPPQVLAFTTDILLFLGCIYTFPDRLGLKMMTRPPRGGVSLILTNFPFMA